MASTLQGEQTGRPGASADRQGPALQSEGGPFLCVVIMVNAPSRLDIGSQD